MLVEHGRRVRRAAEKLIKAGLAMVVAVARRSPPTSVHILDVIQEGNTALMKAGSTWEPERGYSFTPYVTWMVRRAVARFVADTGSRPRQ
jgi:RNA polymerase sigma factor (sigma-70 family)